MFGNASPLIAHTIMVFGSIAFGIRTPRDKVSRLASPDRCTSVP